MGDQRLIYRPDRVSPPGETLADLLEERCLTQKDLALRMGRPLKTINEIVKAKAAITAETALQLEKALGTPSAFWIQRESNYREYLAKVAEGKRSEQWLSWLDTLPLKEMIVAGILPKLPHRTGEDRKVHLQTALRFFGVSSPDDYERIYAKPQVAYRRTLQDQSDIGAIACWLRLGERAAEADRCPDFNRGGFEKALQEIRALTCQPPSGFQKQTIELCRANGVILAFVPAIRRAHVSGVARWIKQKPLIQLSLYGKTNDRFWFTFFHEAGHILLHGKKQVFLDEFSGHLIKSAEEDTANAFAAEILIPRKDAVHLPRLKTRQDVQSFATSIGIHPGIVAGRLQHEKIIPHTWLNDLKVSFRWNKSADG